MSRFFFWINDEPKTCTWRDHPQGENWYKVYLGKRYYGQVFKSRGGGWGAIVSPGPRTRAPSLGGFRTRWDATQYMLWAHGYLKEDDKPFA